MKVFEVGYGDFCLKLVLEIIYLFVYLNSNEVLF